MTINPAIYDGLVIDIGGTFSQVIDWIDGSGNPVDMDGYSASFELRHSVDDALPFFAVEPMLSPGVISLDATPARTNTLQECLAVCNLRMTAGTGDVYDIMGGTINIREAE